MTSADKTEETDASFFKNLANRRVPQIIGIYLGASWGIVQFIEWLVNRYMLSPYLIELTLVILLSLIPSTFIVAYYHGKPGRDKWKRAEKLVIPMNIALTALLVFFLFSNKDLGSVSRTVTLEDETGKKIERVIPKTNFRKKVALFYYKNETGNASLDWLQYGVSHMLEFDLTQDMFLEITAPHTLGIETSDFYFYNKIKKAGYKDGIGLPLLLKKKLAGEIRMDYFLSGKISIQGNDFILESSLYHTKNAKLVRKSTIRGKDIFQLIDDLSVRLKKDLEIPGGHIKEANDLPVAESFTNSLPAARLYTLGQNAIVFENDWAKAENYLKEAIREDPAFASAHRSLAAVYLFTNRTKKWAETYQSVMQYSYKLPERDQLYIKMGYYMIKQDPDKQLAVLRMITKLYPEYLSAHSSLALLLGVMNRWDEAIATYKRMLEIDPQRYETYRKIGALYELKGKFDQALDYYKKYADHFPKDPESFIIIGRLNKRMGNPEQAKENYERALLLDPGSISVLTSLAQIEQDWGNFDKARQRLEEALQFSKTAEDRMNVYYSLASFSEVKGQAEKALEYSLMADKAAAEFSLPLLVLFNKLIHIERFIRAGKEKEAFQTLASIKAQLEPPNDKWVSIGYLFAYIEVENPDEAEKQLPEMQNFITTTTNKQLLFIFHLGKGKIHEMRGEYADAIKSYEAQLKVIPISISVRRNIGRCYRFLKQYKKAEEYFGQALKASPFNPESNYELALVYLDKGDKEKAVKHLKIAADVWKDADPGYKPAQKAKETLTRIEKNEQ